MTNPHVSSLRGPILLRALLTAAVSLLIVLVLPAGIALAHTSFEESSPANGETLSEPVSMIVLQFSGESEYGDDAFTVLAPDGQVRTPTAVSSLDQKTFELTFDPPLAGGEVGVRWAVNAPDAHPIDGVFSFAVTAPAVAAVRNAAPTNGSVADDPLLTATAGNTSDVLETADVSTSASPSLDEFLAEQPARGGEGTARWGRLIGFAAITLLIGGGAFAATTFRGRRAEIERAIGILRVLGATLAAGALLEYIGTARIAEASIVGYWSSQPGMATLLRGAGGLAIAAGLAAVTVPVRAPRAAHSLSAAANATMEYEREQRAQFWSDNHGEDRSRRHPQSAKHASVMAVAQRNITISTSPPPRQPRLPENRDQPIARTPQNRATESLVIRQWVPDRSSTAAYVGVAIAIISFWFDGHTVSKGIRPLHAIVNSVHVVAGSIWLGGVVAMAVVLWTRHRAGVAPRALEMIVRFSGIATVALGAVIAAGGIMAFLVLDSVGELFSTQWGQVLLLKTAAAALAMVGGAYNHFRLLPALEAEPDDPTLIAHLRTAVTSEAIMLGFVIVVTASLVAAAS
jgi:copper transport protein